MIKKTMCELFAGVGGFRLGFDKLNSGWETKWFSQWEPGKKAQWAHNCYVNHFGDAEDLNGDITTNYDISKVDKMSIPDHNLLVGGFPCQNYSVAASKSSKGIEGEKGVLWWQIRDTLIAKRAPFVLLENVDRLLKSPASQRGRDFGIMLTCMAQLGYRVEWRVINAADYGAAQRRRRIFIFAYDKNTEYAKGMDKVSTEEIMTKEGFFASVFPIEDYGVYKFSEVSVCDISAVKAQTLLTEGIEQADNDLLEMTQRYSFLFENSGYMIDGKITTYNVCPKKEKPTLLGDIMVDNADSKYFIDDSRLYYTDCNIKHSDERENNLPKESRQTWQYLKGGKRRFRTSSAGHSYIFSEGPIPMVDEWDSPARTMLTSEGSFNRSTHIVRDKKSGRIRLITPVEAERIQGFDDDWTQQCLVNGKVVDMPERIRFFCMGNALVVPMVTRMGKQLDKIFSKE